MPTENTAPARFDMTARSMLTAAVKLTIVDPVDIGRLMIEHGEDVDAVFAYIDGAAEALMHHRGEARSAWIKIRESVRYMARDTSDDGPDKFGFRAEARAGAVAVLQKHEIWL